MKRMAKYLIFLFPLLLTGCSTGGGSGFDINKLLKNPIIMAIIIIAVLYYVFTHRGK